MLGHLTSSKILILSEDANTEKCYKNVPWIKHVDVFFHHQEWPLPSSSCNALDAQEGGRLLDAEATSTFLEPPKTR